MRTEIYRYQKLIVLALPLVKIFDFLAFLRGINIILIYELDKYWKRDNNKYIIYVRNLTAYLESTPMNYPRHQISKYFG